MTLRSLQKELEALGNPEDALHLMRFFKTGPGQYGEGDRFRGVRVPVLRTLCRKYANTTVDDCVALLQSAFHEDRMLSLLLLVRHYRVGSVDVQQRIFDLYLAHRAQINSWDLVDVTAPHIIGAHLFTRDRAVLTQLAASEDLWSRRIAILSTFHFICKGEWRDTVALATALRNDPHDLIHKAIGWMLREIGKRIDLAILREFLTEHAHRMPRTSLRYAIEKLPAEERRTWLFAGTDRNGRSATVHGDDASAGAKGVQGDLCGVSQSHFAEGRGLVEPTGTSALPRGMRKSRSDGGGFRNC